MSWLTQSSKNLEMAVGTLIAERPLPNFLPQVERRLVRDLGPRAVHRAAASPTWLSLSDNSIGIEGAAALLDALSAEQRGGPLVFLDLRENGDLSELLRNEVLAAANAQGILAAYRRSTAKNGILRWGEFWLCQEHSQEKAQ